MLVSTVSWKLNPQNWGNDLDRCSFKGCKPPSIPTRFKDSRHLVQVCELQTLSHCVFIVGKVFLVL